MRATLLSLAAVLLPMVEPATVLQPNAANGRWEVQKSGVEVDLKAVVFVNDSVGWVVGANTTILQTTDGGKTWRQVHGGAKGPTLEYVQFTNPKTGWARTRLLDTILHTTDGGGTWKKVPLPVPLDSGGFYCVDAAVGSTYILKYGGFVFRTENAGQAWTSVTKKYAAAGQGVGNMWFVDASHGCVAWDEGRYTITQDGGKSWQVGQLKKPETTGRYMYTQFVNSKTGWLLPQFGTIMATTDGGKNWEARQVGHPPTQPQVGMHFVNANVGHVLTGDNAKEAAVRRTPDGGKTWDVVVQVKDAPGKVHGLSFPSTKHGWVVGDKGYIGHYYEVDK